jgi:hypothetical protein
MQTRPDDALLEALHRETGRKLARQDGLRARIRESMQYFGDDEQPRTRLPQPGLWSEEWRHWDRSSRRYRYRPPKEDLVSKVDYELLCHYGTLEQMEVAWAAIEPRLPKWDYVPASSVKQAVVCSPPRRDVTESVARVKEGMIKILVDNPNAELTGSGACALVATKGVGVAAKTMSGWFTGSDIRLKQLLKDLLPQASLEATERRAQGAG